MPVHMPCQEGGGGGAGLMPAYDDYAEDCPYCEFSGTRSEVRAHQNHNHGEAAS